MTDLIARVRGYFLELDEGHAACPARARGRPPRRVGLVGPPGITAAAGAVLALALARAHSSRWAVLCRFGATPGGAPAVPPARRAAATLRAADLRADAAGRLVRITLDEDTALLSATIDRVAELAPGPTVLALDCARDDGVDRVLAGQDALAWLATDTTAGPFAELLAASLGVLGPPVYLAPRPSALARRLARAGLAAPGASEGGLSALEGSNRWATLRHDLGAAGEERAGPISSRAKAGPRGT